MALLDGSIGIADGFLQGGYDENSFCWGVKKCKRAKESISNACGPVQAAYGENAYRACVKAAQTSPRPGTKEQFLCDPRFVGPQEAFGVFGSCV